MSFLRTYYSVRNMPHIDSVLTNFKTEKKVLKVQLEEGESILKALPVALTQNNVREAKVEEINGTLKEALINYFSGNKFYSKKLSNTQIFRAHGNVRESFGDLYGSIHVSITPKNPFSGTLVNAIAGKDSEVVLSFLEYKPNTPIQRE